MAATLFSHYKSQMQTWSPLRMPRTRGTSSSHVPVPILLIRLEHRSPGFQSLTVLSGVSDPKYLSPPIFRPHLPIPQDLPASFLLLAWFCGKKPQEPSLSTQEVGPMPHPRPRTQISSLAKVGGAGCGRPLT